MLDIEVKERLESLSRGVNAALDHFLQDVQRKANQIKTEFPMYHMTTCAPYEWVCSICGTGMLHQKYTYVHVCDFEEPDAINPET
jgi:hypothetical protein